MVFPFVAAALGGLGMLAGGIMGQRSHDRAVDNWNERADAARREPQIIRNHVDLQRLVADAEAAGFNPLTVLRAGGVGGYNVQQHPNLHPLPDVASHGRSPLGDAIGGIGSMVMDFGLSNMSAAFQSSLAPRGGGAPFAGQIMSVPTTSTASTVSMAPRHQGGSLSPNGAGNTLGMPAWDQWTEEVSSVTNPFAGDWWHSNPYMSDVETGFEARYGDVVGAIGGAVTLAGDVGWNLGRFAHHIVSNVRPEAAAQLQSAWDRLMSHPPATGSGSGPLSLRVGGPNHGELLPAN